MLIKKIKTSEIERSLYNLRLEEVTKISYGRKTKIFNFFRKIDIFGQKGYFFLPKLPENIVF